MRKDDHLIFEALQSKFTQTAGAESADAKKERVQRGWQINKDRWAKWKKENPEAAAKHAAKKQGKSENAEETAEQRIAAVKQAVAQAKGQIAQAKTQGHMKHYGDGLAKALGKSENAENEPHGYPQGITAIQNLLINQLKKHGFTLTKISHADKDRDKYPTVFMQKSQGAMHIGAEIDGMGYINGEPFKEYMMVRGYDAKNAGDKPYTPAGARPDPEDPAYDTWQSIAQDHAGEDAESYSAMMHLTQAANQIRDILQSHADDEAQVEHIIKMAQIILGPKSDHTDAEYRKMLDGLIVILNRFIVVPMN
jgi:hypothetical protein